MFRFLKNLFSSPEGLLTVMSHQEIEEAKEEGERIFIDEDGGATINIGSIAVKEDFARHVATLRYV